MHNFENIRRLYQLPETQDFGFSQQQIKHLQDSLGLQLPQILIAYYQTLGQSEAVNQSHNRLLQPDDEVELSDDGYLIIVEENQNVVVWGIKATDLVLDNPPVWGNYGSDAQPDWHLESERLSDFFLLMAIYNGTLGGLAYNANSFETVDPQVVVQIQQHWDELQGFGWKGQKIYTNQFDEVIRLSFDQDGGCNAIFIGTSDLQRYEKMLDQLDIDWDYLSDEDELFDEDEEFEA